MLIKRGPYGQFAVEKAKSPDNIFEYASEVIDKDPAGFFLPCSVDVTPQGTYLSFDCTGLTPLDSFVPDTKKIATLKGRKKDRKEELRKNLGRLLYSFTEDLDMLLNPANIVLDGRYIFTDPAGEELKICYLPLKCNSSTPELCSLGAQRMERLLASSFFDGILSEDEKQELIYAIDHSDERLYKLCIDSIVNKETDKDTVKTGINPELIYAALGLILTPLLYKVAGILPCLLSLTVTCLSLIRLLRSQRTISKVKYTEKARKTSEERKEILFSQEAAGIASLKLLSPVKGSEDSYSILMDKVAIGSDVFLSDIVLDNPTISPIHALIMRTRYGYYISSCSNTGRTYVENKRILSGDKQEIKSGQKITLGEIEFRFDTGLK
ncbi:MAG: FHA domain-containing protein [Saccharofermentans sp.]|nr:FHA domain-containing protein [Saccharofermentans sp.]